LNKKAFIVAISAGALAILPTLASAVPSFARQTGMECAACHTSYPNLTPFGRRFLLSGYTLGGTEKIEGVDANGKERLSLNKFLPLAARVQASYTEVDKKTGTTDKSSVALDRINLYFAGAVTSNIGTFINLQNSRAKYTDGLKGNETADTALANVVVRYSDKTADGGLTYGLTLADKPSFHDAWAVDASAGSLMDTLNKSSGVAGLAPYLAYEFGDNLLYAEYGIYRSTGKIIDLETNKLTDFANYARLAYERTFGNSSLQVGASILEADLQPVVGAVAGSDRYRDIGMDAEYQYINGSHIVGANLSWAKDDRDLNATFATAKSTNPTYSQTAIKAGALYLYDRKYGIEVQYADLNGNADAKLYTLAKGYATNQPDATSVALTALYLPRDNTKLSLKYLMYSKFNGASTNYDGLLHNASDNDQLSLAFDFLF